MGQDIIIELDPKVRVPVSVLRGGTFEGWREMVDKVVGLPAEAVPHWRLALCAAFVGCLVDFLEMPSCGINLSGATSIGKTTAQKLACSAWSVPLPKDGSLFHSANTTVNAFELMAARSNGHILIIDELALKSGKELQELIFRLSGNRSRGRLTRDAEARQSWEWRTFALLSSEQALEEKIRGDRNATWTAGAAARILDIGLDGQVGKLPKAMVDDIQLGAQRHHGHAGYRFARVLLDYDAAGRTDELRATLAELTRRLATDSGDLKGAEARTMEVFALVKLAAKIAVAAGILPRAIDVDGTVKWAVETFLQTGGGGLDARRQAIDALKLWVAQNWNVAIFGCGPTTALGGGMGGPVRTAEAWYDQHAVYIPAADICRLADSTVSRTAIADELHRRNLLYLPKLEKGKKFTRRVPRHPGITCYPLKRPDFGSDDKAT